MDAAVVAPRRWLALCTDGLRVELWAQVDGDVVMIDLARPGERSLPLTVMLGARWLLEDRVEGRREAAIIGFSHDQRHVVLRQEGANHVRDASP